MSYSITQQPRKLEGFDDFQSELGENFVIFCGSAISSHPITPISDDSSQRHFLPMVYDVSEILLKGLTLKLQTKSYYERLIGYYSQSLIDGKYASLRTQAKFETLLGQLEEILGTSKDVQAFLSALFLCTNQQFGYNHAAIAALLKANQAIGCLTTNFDNAIELAFPSVNKFVHPLFADYATFLRGSCLLKLHGDVIEGGYVATLSELLKAEQIEAHKYIQSLLEGKTVLIAGYSGFGDVDIAPHLQALAQKETKLIWIIRKGTQSPSFATHYYISDLWTDQIYDSDEERNNCLIKLAQPKTNYHNDDTSHPNWQERTIHWFETIEISKLQNIVYRIFSWRGDWPALHLHHTKLWQQGLIPDKALVEDNIYHSILCVRARAYYSAKSILLNIAPSLRKPVDDVYYYFYLGFIDWRLQNLDFSLKNFEFALNVYNEAEMFNMPYRNANPNYQPIYHDDALRLYLEVSRDILSKILFFSSRKNFYEKHELKNKIDNILKEIKNLPNHQLLSLLIVYYIQYLVRENLDKAKVIELYQRARNLQALQEAGAIARLLVLIDRKKGIAAMREVNGDLESQHNRTNVWQNRLEILRSVSPIKSLYTLENLGGQIAFGFKTIMVEAIYYRNLRKWKQEFTDKKLPNQL